MRRSGVHGGWVGEREALLGSRAAGAFGRMTADSAFAGIEARPRVGAWRLGAGAEIGTVSTSVQGGLIANVSPLTTSAFALQAVQPLNDGDTFTLSLSQPLRVESGHASLSVPVGRTKDGLVRRRPVTADFVPTGRQIEVTAQCRRMLSTGGELRLGAAWTRHPGTRGLSGARPPPSSPAGAIPSDADPSGSDWRRLEMCIAVQDEREIRAAATTSTQPRPGYVGADIMLPAYP